VATTTAQSTTPTIVVTVGVPAGPEERDRVRTNEKNERYLDHLRRAGAAPIVLDETSTEAERSAAFGSMDGLLLTGGGDLHPGLYGEPLAGARNIQPGRDALEREAWVRARHRHVPVLGICRGLQAINVFSGGSLVQHLDDHEPPPGSATSWRTHPLRLAPGSRFARILRPTGAASAVVQVNSSHHQAVRREGLAPGYVVAGTSPAAGGELVEAFESADPREFVLAVQSHPERVDSTPPEFARLWRVFVDACRGSASGARVG
jgi:putative glutamine amidotransferase